MGRLLRYLLAVIRILNGAGDGLRWPPGRLSLFTRIRRQQQTFLLEQAHRHGPIFKQWMHGEHTTCVVGHTRGRTLLRDAGAVMTGVTIGQSGLYPLGNVRSMQGDTHKRYRRLLIDSINAVPFATHRETVRASVMAALSGCVVAGGASGVVPPQALMATLHAITTDVMLLFVFGAMPDSEVSRALRSAYAGLSDTAPVVRIGDRQRRAFAEAIAILRFLEAPAREAPRSYLGYLATTGMLDDTLRGNLVYLVETVRFDLASLWRWLLYYLTGRPAVVERIGDEIRAGTVFGNNSLLTAAVMETLRLNQSEYIARRVHADVAFEGYLIPRHSRVRVCVWEGHKDPEVFPEPFAFLPERFLAAPYSADHFAPFGMDKHHCLGVDFTMETTRAFAAALVECFAFTGLNAGQPTIGKHHWEPGEAFTLRLARAGTLPGQAKR